MDTTERDTQDQTLNLDLPLVTDDDSSAVAAAANDNPAFV
jgi:hypothetical protein